jgi:Mg/Co/Ni transporter MgtE
MSATAADIMTADCLVVESTLSLPDIINFFQEKKLYTVPVVDKKKILVGIVTVADIIKLI